jgi:hypothetical protein
VSIKGEERFGSSHIDHKSKETPQIVPLCFHLHYFIPEKKK